MARILHIIHPQKLSLIIENNEDQLSLCVLNGCRYNLTLIRPSKPIQKGKEIDWIVLQEQLRGSHLYIIDVFDDPWAIEIFIDGSVTRIGCNDIHGLP